MIRHLVEVWLLLAAAFLIGSFLGAMLYRGLAIGPLAFAQGRVADAIGDVVDAIKDRLGIGPEWRPRVRQQTKRQTAELAEDAPVEEWRGRVAPVARRAEPNEPRARARVGAERENAGPQAEWDDSREWEELAVIEDAVAADEYQSAPSEEYESELPEPEFPEPTLPEPELPEREVRMPAAELPEMRPAGLLAPRNGVPDNLQRIRGVGQKNEEMLNSLGIFHFGQIAAWTPAEVRWISAYMAFPERVERDDWVGQATILATGRDTGYVKTSSRRSAAEESAEEGSG